jgi:FtsZ-binding cell division protein ZapB
MNTEKETIEKLRNNIIQWEKTGTLLNKRIKELQIKNNQLQEDINTVAGWYVQALITIKNYQKVDNEL